MREAARQNRRYEHRLRKGKPECRLLEEKAAEQQQAQNKSYRNQYYFDQTHKLLSPNSPGKKNLHLKYL